MLMKPFIFLVLAGLASLISCNSNESGASKKDAEYTAEMLEVTQFDTLDVSSAWTVELQESDRYSVSLNYPADIRKHIVARCENGRLRLDIVSKGDSDPLARNDLKQYISANRPKALITLPSFDKIILDESASLNFCEDFFIGKCNIAMHGASNISGGILHADSVRIHMDGAAVLDTKIKAGTVAFNRSISASFKPSLSAQSLALTQTGASSVVLGEQYYKEGIMLSLDISENATMEAGKVPFEKVVVDAAGSSAAVVHPTKILEVNASGASSVRYIFTKELAKNISENDSATVRIE